MPFHILIFLARFSIYIQATVNTAYGFLFQLVKLIRILNEEIVFQQTRNSEILTIKATFQKACKISSEWVCNRILSSYC